MDQSLLSIREQTYSVHYAIDGRTQPENAQIGLSVWDTDLAQAVIADRLRLAKNRITVMEHRHIQSRDADCERCPKCARIVYPRNDSFHCDYCGWRW